MKTTTLSAQVVSESQLAALEAAIADIAPGIPVVRTYFRPAPLEPVAGAKVFLATTAPARILPLIVRSLEERDGCTVVHASSNLSSRPALSAELAQFAGEYDTVLTELKAAAVDVVTREALASGCKVVFFDNEPVTISGLPMPELTAELARMARERFTPPAALR